MLGKHVTTELYSRPSVYVCAYLFVHVEVRGQYQMSYSIPSTILFETLSGALLELADSAGRASQGAPEVLQSPTTTPALRLQRPLHLPLSVASGPRTQVLTHAQQMLYHLSYLFSRSSLSPSFSSPSPPPSFPEVWG